MRHRLEQERAHSSHFPLFLHEDLEVLVDDSDSKQDTSTTANGSCNTATTNVTQLVHNQIKKIFNNAVYLTEHTNHRFIVIWINKEKPLIKALFLLLRTYQGGQAPPALFYLVANTSKNPPMNLVQLHFKLKAITITIIITKQKL